MQRSLPEKVAPVGVVANLYLKGENMLVHRCDMCKKDIKKAYYTIKVNVETIDDADLDINELNSDYIRYSAVPLGCEIELCRECFTRRDNFLRRINELGY